MATVVTSIGSNSSIDTETPSSCSGSYSPYDVTFSTDPTGVSVGDRVEISDEGVYWATFVYRVTAISGSTYTLAYVSDDAYNGDASPCELVDGSYSQAPATFKRFYSSITNWEAGLDDSDVYASSDDAVGECHNDSVFAESVTIENGGTVGLASVTLSVHPDSRHDGTAGTGARMLPTSVSSPQQAIVQIERGDVTVQWLEISGESITSSSSYGNIGVWVSVGSGSANMDNVSVRNNVIHDMNEMDTGSSQSSIGIYLNATDSNYYILNNFVYNINRAAEDAWKSTGIYAHSSVTYTIYNNTVFNITDTTESPALATGIRLWGSNEANPNDTTVVNNISLSAARCYHIERGDAGDLGVIDYNLSDDTTASGSNSVTSYDGATAANTIADTTSGSENLHLISGSYAVGAGSDLGTTPTGVEIDIDGRDRDAEGDTWDIGADQAVGLSVSITPAASSFELAGVSPSVGQSSLTITVAVAAFVLAGITPAIARGSISLTPSVAAFELAGVSPSVATGSLTASPAAAAFELAGVTPTILFGNTTVSPTVAAFELAGVSPSVATGSLTASPAVAAFELAGVSPTTVNGSISLTPSVAAFELAGVSPTLLFGSTTASPAAASFELAGVTPTIVFGSTTASPAAATFELAAVSPSVGIPVLLTPAVASFELAGVTPTAIAGSLSLTPSVTAIEFAGVSPSVTQASLSVAPGASAIEFVGVTPTTTAASVSLTPAVAAIEFVGISPSVTHSNISITPAAAVTNYRARYGSIILGGIIVIPVQEAGFIYTAVDPAVEISSQTITVAASAFELAGVTPSVVVANIIIAPAASVVEFAASVETIHAGVEVPPAAAAFDYVVGSFTLRVEMDSASLGYSCDGLNDYIGGTMPTDYSIEKNLDYRYDHTS